MVTAITKLINNWILSTSVVLSLLFVMIAIQMNNLLIALAPVGLVIGLLMVQDLRYLFFLFAMMIPFSIEVSLPGGLGTDLPSEPIMWLLTIMSIPFFIIKSKDLDGHLWRHPITLLWLLHLVWIGVTALSSQFPLLSVKFFAAKIWYLIPFYFLFYYVFSKRERLENFFDLLLGATTVAVIVIMGRHALSGFAFSEINSSVSPIFRNHVNYAVMLVILLPYLYLRAKQTRKKKYSMILLLFLAAIYFSYTRAAILSVFIGIGAYYVLRWRLTKLSIVATLLAVGLSIPYFLTNNRFMEFAPNYERTIAHYEFDNLLEATYKLEDISTMERVYRWMAGREMILQKPWLGFGPATFYSFYQNYSISTFQTYVSNNPEKSGIHNYYLMTVVEQGVFGGVIFFILLIFTLVYAEKLYNSVNDKYKKQWVAAAFTSIVMLSAILTINDLIEVDKIGPFFFMSFSIIVIVWRWSKKAK